MPFTQLVQEIKEYESDTFSAEANQLTDEEAEHLAEKCIRHFVLNHMDGVMLTNFLYDMRFEN